MGSFGHPPLRRKTGGGIRSDRGSREAGRRIVVVRVDWVVCVVGAKAGSFASFGPLPRNHLGTPHPVRKTDKGRKKKGRRSTENELEHLPYAGRKMFLVIHMSVALTKF